MTRKVILKRKRNLTENQHLNEEKEEKSMWNSQKNKVDDLESEAHCLRRKLRFYEQNEKLEALSQKESILQYLTGKYDEYDKLEGLIKNYDNTKEKEDAICKCINTLKIRQGSQGFVRKQTVNYLLKKVVEKIVPGHVKYIVASCANENGYFEKTRGRKLAK